MRLGRPRAFLAGALRRELRPGRNKKIALGQSLSKGLSSTVDLRMKMRTPLPSAQQGIVPRDFRVHVRMFSNSAQQLRALLDLSAQSPMIKTSYRGSTVALSTRRPLLLKSTSHRRFSFQAFWQDIPYYSHNSIERTGSASSSLLFNLNLPQRQDGCCVKHYSNTPSRLSGGRNYYEVLGLPKDGSASQEQIKRAYFERARKCHPDLYPGDSEATSKFQELSHAYSVLKDPAARRQYDWTGSDPDLDYGSTSSSWEREWEQVWGEYGFESYLKEVKEEGQRAIDAIRRDKDWSLAQDFASKHRVLILGVLLPIVVGLRFPALILAGLRVASSVAALIFAYLPGHYQRHILGKVWQIMVRSSKTWRR